MRLHHLFFGLGFGLAVSLVAPMRVEAQKYHAPRKLLKPTKPFAISYFPALRWRATLGMDTNSTPVIGDLDADGALDLVVPAVNSDGFTGKDRPTLMRLSAGGGVIWRYPLPARVTAGATLGDIARDGTLDILVACGKQLLCIDASGHLVWSFKTSENIESLPTIADIDQDGKNEVLFGADDGALHVLNTKGQERWSFKTRSWIVGGVAVANITSDKNLEVIVGSMDSTLYCLDAKGHVVWKYEADNWFASAPAIGDVDGDGFLEVVASSDDGHLYCLSRRGTLKWTAEFAASETRGRPYLALADLDGDGTLETILSNPDGQLEAYLSNGDKAWSSYGSATVGAPLVADLNGDGYQEVLVATADGHLKAISTWGSNQWDINLGQTVRATPALADSDHDGKWEIYVANLMSSTSDAGFLSAYELSTVGGTAAWPSMKGDPYRTGLASNGRDYGANLRRGIDYSTAWEPFGAGYRPTTGVQPPRRLRVSLVSLDDARGNRDGALDVGETAWVRVKVQNLGHGPSYDNLLKLDLGKSFLKLDRSSAYLGWIAPGATKSATFRITAPSRTELDALSETDPPFVDINAPQAESPERVKGQAKRGKTVKYGPQSLLMSVLETGVPAALARATVYDVPPLPPQIKIARLQIFDGQSKLTAGNGNHRLDAGETVVLRLLLSNQNLTTATTATATLASATRDILPATPSVQMSQIVPLGGREVSFSLRVAKRLVSKQARLKLSVYATTKGGKAQPVSQEIKLPLGGQAGDVTSPKIVLQAPKTAIFTTRASSILLRGQIADDSKIALLRFQGKQEPLLPQNRFAFQRSLQVGENVFSLAATDAAGNSTTRWIRIIRRP